MDVSAIGNAWLEQQRRQYLAVDVTVVVPGLGTSRVVKATVTATRRTAMDSAGAFTTVQTRAFLVSRADLPEDPVRGMRVTLVEGGRTLVYEAAAPSIGETVWEWTDRLQTLRRIHCTPVAVPAPTGDIDGGTATIQFADLLDGGTATVVALDVVSGGTAVAV